MIYIDSATLSLNGGAKPVEMYIPLYFCDGTTTTAMSGGNQTSLNGFINDGVASVTGNQYPLFNLSNKWQSSQQYALEVTMLSSSASNTAYALLWDTTTGTAVASTQVSTTSTTATVVRSANFTLTPSHSYLVKLWNGSTGTVSICDASLIIFP